MKRELLILDNYDSFTYNLVGLVEKCGYYDYEIYKNDEISIENVNDFSSIILSPGPGLPQHAGIMQQLLRNYIRKKKILGVCLGHQAIARHFGANLIQMDKITHGDASIINIIKRSSKLFKNIPQDIIVGRYHSWVVDNVDFPKDELEISAILGDRLIMGIEHKFLPVYGIQFHPESYITQYGFQILKNWLEI